MQCNCVLKERETRKENTCHDPCFKMAVVVEHKVIFYKSYEFTFDNFFIVKIILNLKKQTKH